MSRFTPRGAQIARKWDKLDDLDREIEWRMCSRDSVEGFAYFCRNYYAIKVPGRGQIPLDLTPEQYDTAKIWMTNRNSVTVKARQIGFSTLCGALGLWDVMFFPDREDLFLSKTGDDAKKLLRGLKYAWNALPAEMRSRAGSIVTNTQDMFELDHGSMVKSLNSNNPARGYTGFRIFLDEYAHFEDPEGAWSSVDAAGDVGGSIHVLSTANGVGNPFHDMWVRATTGVSGWPAIFYPWTAAHHRDQAWYDRKRREIPEWLLHQEYPTTAEEAFIQSGRPVFDMSKLHFDIRTPDRIGYLDYVGARMQVVDVAEGELYVWEEPMPRDKYVLGADVAEGLEHGDFSVAFVINTRSGEIAAKWRGHVDPDTFGEVIANLGNWYNRALIGVEINNHGHSVVSMLKRLRYGNVYYRTSYDQRTHVTSNKLGWLTTSQTKPLMIDELRMALRDGEIHLHDSEVVGELTTYVRDLKGKMGGSPFDDQVMALAVANQMRKHFFTQVDGEAPADIRGTGWELELQIRQRENQLHDWVIGSPNGSRYVTQ